MAKSIELKTKIAEARRIERYEAKSCYVVWDASEQAYVLEYRMPIMGEWYTSDGIQHGPSHR